MPRKPTHGGARKGAGRPETTGSSSTPPVHFRLTKAERTDIDSVSSKPNLFAKAATLAAVKRAKRTPPPSTKGP